MAVNGKKKRILVLAAVFIAALTVFEGVAVLFLRSRKNDDVQRYAYIASDRASYIKTCIERVMIRTDTIVDLVEHYDGDTSFFDETSKELFNKIKDETGVEINSFAVAPGGIVEKVYPQFGNDVLIGFDLMDETMPGNMYTQEAYKSGETVISEPYEFVQGGFGISARTPVFLDGEEGRKFWGIVSVTMDFFDLLECFDLETLSDVGIDYELWYNDASNEKVALVSPQFVHTDEVTAPIRIGNMEWFISLEPSSGWYSEKIAAVLILFAALLAVAVTLLLHSVLRLKDANSRLKMMAITDPLTECYSRAYLHMNIVDASTVAWISSNNVYSLALVDIDNLKMINDTYGHVAGDRAINAIAHVLKKNIDDPCGDCVVRFGGDEFIILWNRAAMVKIETDLKRIVSDVNKTKLEGFDDLELSVSIGAAYNDGTTNASYDELFKCADAMVYIAKNSGRNCYEVKSISSQSNV